jgi:hypothetical protein
LIKASRILGLNFLETIFLSHTLYENGYISYYFSKNMKYKDKNMVKNTLRLFKDDPKFEGEAEFLLKNIETKDLQFEEKINSSYCHQLFQLKSEIRTSTSFAKKQENFTL